jgi:zinc transporter 2
MSAFVVAILGSHIAALPASEAHTFGLKRTESLAALFSMVSLAILSVGLAVEALRRMYFIFQGGEDIQQVDGKLMSTIAFIGVIVNVILAYVLGEDHVHMVGAETGFDHGGHDHSHGHEHGHEETESFVPPQNGGYASIGEAQHTDELVPADPVGRNVNLHAAYLHVLADLAQSVVVFVAGLIIWYKPTWQITDPICTLIFSVLVCWSTVNVIRSSLSVLLEEVPPGVEWDEVFDAIKNVQGVSNVHDLHIWSISHGQSCLSVHAAAEDIESAYRDITRLCHKRKITHLTIQLQPATIDDCVTCIDGSVHQCR